VAILTLVVCGLVASACETDMSSSPTPYATASSSEARPSLANAGIVLSELPEAQAWRAIKKTFGSSVLVLRPTAVPNRFDGDLLMIEYAYLNGTEPRYRVGYRAADGLINIAAGAVNWGPPTSTETIALRGLDAHYSTSSSWPERGIEWTEGGVLYTIQARGISRAELLEIANGLVAVE
jgi:hypothetical protein